MITEEELINTIILTRLSYFHLNTMVELYNQLGSATAIIRQRDHLKTTFPGLPQRIADDLMDAMVQNAKEMSAEMGKLQDLPQEEADKISAIIGLGALKYFILKVDPRKNMTFNPKESIDFNGNTGPFVQYTYARIQSVLRKAADKQVSETFDASAVALNDKEISLIQRLADFPAIVAEAGRTYSPALVANYVYELVKEYNQFYHDYKILGEENADLRGFRLTLSRTVGDIIRQGFWMLGIEVPERM